MDQTIATITIKIIPEMKQRSTIQLKRFEVNIFLLSRIINIIIIVFVFGI